MSQHTPATNGAAHAAEAHAHDPSKDVALYAKTLGTLLVLTIITVAAAGFNFGSANVVIALTIATIKAILVASFFMHLAHDKPVNAIIAAGGFIFLGIFLLFVLLDVGTRPNLQPRNMPAMEKATPTPSTLNPLLVPPPQPPAPAAKSEEAGEHK